MQKVESFKLGHTKVKAPYIRECCVLDGAKEYAREVLEKGFSLNIYGE
jgi:S-ribosylhomocysteine lyase LuxS involved in autoinducer biosynthesis